MLLLMDGTKESEDLLDCSVRIFDNNENHYNCAFVEGVSSDNLNEVFSSSLLKENQYTRSEIIGKILHTKPENSDEFINRFIKKCDDLNLKTKVYLTAQDVNKQFAEEGIYNDIFLISKSVFFKSNFDKHLFKNLESVLYHSKCPLLILDCNQKRFENIVLIYDGSKRSFDAIKMFSYLLDNLLANNKINLLLVSVVNENSIENEKNVMSYIKQTRLNFAVQHVYPDNYYATLLDTLKKLKNFILVSGVNRNEIIEDMAFNKDKSLFLNLPCSIFLT